MQELQTMNEETNSGFHPLIDCDEKEIPPQSLRGICPEGGAIATRSVFKTNALTFAIAQYLPREGFLNLRSVSRSLNHRLLPEISVLNKLIKFENKRNKIKLLTKLLTYTLLISAECLLFVIFVLDLNYTLDKNDITVSTGKKMYCDGLGSEFLET